MYVHIIEHTNIKLHVQNNKHMNIHSPKIMELLRKEKVITSSEAAKLLKVSWNTADRILTELLIEKKVVRIKKEGVNLWLLQ